MRAVTERRGHAWIRWDRIEPDYRMGMAAALCATRENARLDQEGEPRRVRPQTIRTQAYLKGWTRHWERVT